jgi:formylglycine-generating enzyme required for sulfatase activity
LALARTAPADSAGAPARTVAADAAAVPARAAAAGSADAPARTAAGNAGIQWVEIPGGTFAMGSGSEDESPVHRVTIPAFHIAKTLVTNKQYNACVAAGACVKAYSYGPEYDGDDQPLVGVTWDQAKAFSKWAGGRLPTEAEWEYAARSAGKDQKYPWGDEEATCANAALDECEGRGTAHVCSKPAGNTEQGLCDMVGKVWEWVEDGYHENYNGAPTDGSAWAAAGSRHVMRGGVRTRSGSVRADYPGRAAHRDGEGSFVGNSDVGFRPAR